MFAEVEALSVNVEGEEPSIALIVGIVFKFDINMCDTVRSIAVNAHLWVMKVILRVNLRHEPCRMKLIVRTNAVKKFLNVRKVISRNVEENKVAAESRRKRDILRYFHRLGLVERKRAGNP